MNHQINQRYVYSSLLVTAFLTGCTHMINPPKQAFTGYTARDKIALKVGLNITDELRKAKWEKHSMGDTWVIPIGKAIVQNAGGLARQTFSDVVDLNDGGSAQTGSVDAILTPKVAYVNRTQGATSFGKSIVAIKLEWNLTDPGGRSIWLETVSGESSGSTGWTDPEKILGKALEDVLKKSQEAIASAEAIRQFAATRQR